VLELVYTLTTATAVMSLRLCPVFDDDSSGYASCCATALSDHRRHRPSESKASKAPRWLIPQLPWPRS